MSAEPGASQMDVRASILSVRRWALESAFCRCLAASIFLVLCVYPDVIFLKASLLNSDIVNVTMGEGRERVQLYPERGGRSVSDGFYDFGGSVFQSEPGAQFVRRSFENGQSIYWNPYSATGSYGPETLVDVKTSPLSIAVSVLGGGTGAYHVVFLGFSVLAVFCLLMLLAVEFRLGFTAGLAGGVTYLLNGYNVAFLGSNVSQAWLYFPIVTLALVSFARSPGAMKLVGISFGSTLLLATTFLPTTLLTLATACFIGAAASLAHSMDRGRGISLTLQIVAGQALGVMLGMCILSIVYLPIMEATKYMATYDFYSARIFYVARFFDFISFFTPKHAFETYSAITERASRMRGNAVFHQGIVGALLATQIFRSWPVFQRVIVSAVSGMLIFLVLRIYGLPGLTTVVNAIPLAGSFGEQYLWISVGLLFTITVAFGVHALLRSGPRLVPLFACGASIILALIYTTSNYGLENVAFTRYLWIAVAVLAGATALVTLRGYRLAPMISVSCLLLLSFAELTFYVNHYRLARTDRFLEPSPFVRFLQSQGGLHRIATYGASGLPPEYGSAFGIYQIESMNFQLFPKYADVFNRLLLPNPQHRWTSFATFAVAPDVDSFNLRALDFLGARFLVVRPSNFPRLAAFMKRSSWVAAYNDANFTIYENLHPLPRAYVVHELSEGHETPLDVDKSPLSVAMSDDPVLIAEARTKGIADAGSAGPANSEEAKISRYDHTSIEISVNIARAGVLVLNDAWHPNWTVQVDGVARHLGVVNEAFRGIVLESGQHTVNMQYAPRTLAAGKLMTIIGLALALLLILFRRWTDSMFTRLNERPRVGPARRQ